MGVILIGQ